MLVAKILKNNYLRLMARNTSDTVQQYASIEADILAGRFSPYYLIFGKEHFYIDRLCSLLMDKALPPEERDFGQLVFYGADADAAQVVSAARQYPMMVSRQVVVVKEAQMMRKIEQLADYYPNIMPSTILIVCYKTPNEAGSTKNIDKRTKFYKDASKVGVVFESDPVPEGRIPLWIEKYVSSKGMEITPDASMMMAEACGTDLSKIALEVDKLSRLFAQDTGKRITADIVEENVGISRDYSVFELTKALSAKDTATVYRIAVFFGQSPKRFPIQMTMGALSSHFIKLMRYHAAVADRAPRAEIASAVGINPYFLGEYETAARNYPLKKCMKVIATLREYDYRSKSNARGSADDGELLLELVSRILNG